MSRKRFYTTIGILIVVGAGCQTLKGFQASRLNRTITPNEYTEKQFSVELKCNPYKIRPNTELLNVPYASQKPDYCGEACLEMVTAFFGRRVPQDEINRLSGLNGLRGVYSSELLRVIQQIDLVTKFTYDIPLREPDDFITYRSLIIRALKEGNPVLLAIWYDYNNKKNPRKWIADHFVLAVGYDLHRNVFYIHDPARHPCWELSFKEFEMHTTNRFKKGFRIEFTGLPP